MKPVIEDDFLDQDYFNLLQKKIMGDSFSWFYVDYVVDKNKQDTKFQFIHTVYHKTLDDPDTYEHLRKMLEKMGAKSVWRIKFNLIPRTPKIVQNEFHTDIHEDSDVGWFTSVFCINSNDGYTIFEDGTKAESVANRLITFPAKTKHTGTSCTNQKRRVVINFNFRKYLTLR